MAISIVQAMVAASTEDVTIGPITYRLRQICSEDILVRGGGTLLALPGADEPDEEELKQRMLAAARRDPQALVSHLAFLRAAAAAGVVAASKDGGTTWEPFQVVLDVHEEDAAQNRVHYASLPPKVLYALAKAVLALTGEEGRAATRLASFLGAGAPAPAPGGVEVRDRSVQRPPVAPVSSVAGDRVPRRGAGPRSAPR